MFKTALTRIVRLKIFIKIHFELITEFILNHHEKMIKKYLKSIICIFLINWAKKKKLS